MGFAAVLSLLAVACANAGGLLSARAARRRRGLAVRAALGAGRARLVRQLLAEGVSLWAIASTVGLFLAARYRVPHSGSSSYTPGVNDSATIRQDRKETDDRICAVRRSPAPAPRSIVARMMTLPPKRPRSTS
jgi:hypothetical protein